MAREHNEHWNRKRQELLNKIKEVSESLGLDFQKLKFDLNGEIDKIDILNQRQLNELKEKILDKYRSTAQGATDKASGLVDDSANLAKEASELTDKAVFGRAISVQLGKGSKKAANILKHERFTSGFKLSDKLWPTDKQNLTRFFGIVEDGLKNGTALGKVVERMAELKIDKAPVQLPKYIKELEDAARGAAQGLPNAKAEYNRLVKRVKTQLAKRKVGELIRPTQQPLGILGTRRQTELFLARINRAVKQGSTQLLKDAVDEHLVKRAEYHSVRAARTMAGRAFRKAGQEERKKRPWVIGEKWTLSPSHPRFDECDLRATVDLGMGRGVYPVGQAPEEHVNGLCWLTDVIDENYLDKGEAEKPKFKKDWKKDRDDVSTGSLYSKTANNLGRKQHDDRIAKEMADLGSQGLVSKNTADSVPKKFSFEEVKAVANQSPSTKVHKKAKQDYLDSLSKVDAPGEINTGINVPLSKEELPFTALKKAREEVQRELKNELNKQARKAIELNKTITQAGATITEETIFASQLSGILQQVQELKTGKLKTKLTGLKKAFESTQEKINSIQTTLAKTASKKKRVPAKTVYDASEFEQIGPQGGSNPGGLFEHKMTGEKWYIKYPSNPNQARSEALAAELYNRGGVTAPQVLLVKDGNKLGVMSKFVEGLQRNPAKLKKGNLKSLHEGFAFDAWLANWDVVGLDFDNMLIKNGRVYRIDTGGALQYRAQGALKPDFGPNVTEFDSLRNPSTGAGRIFQNISKEDIIKSTGRLEKISDQKIRNSVKRFGLPRSLADTLIERKKDVLERARRLAAEPERVQLKVLRPEDLDEFQRVNKLEGSNDFRNNILSEKVPVLGEAIRTWTGSTRAIQKAIFNNNVDDYSWKLGQSINDVAKSSTAIVPRKKIYRGLKFYSDSEWQDFLADHPVGQPLSVRDLFSSWSKDINVARNFAGSGSRRAILVLENETDVFKAIDMEFTSSYPRERELVNPLDLRTEFIAIETRGSDVYFRYKIKKDD